MLVIVDAVAAQVKGIKCANFVLCFFVSALFTKLFLCDSIFLVKFLIGVGILKFTCQCSLMISTKFLGTESTVERV